MQESSQDSEIIVRVRKGIRVNVEEVEELRDDDPRIPADRDVHIVGSTELKIAIKGVNPEGITSRGSLVLRCG